MYICVREYVHMNRGARGRPFPICECTHSSIRMKDACVCVRLCSCVLCACVCIISLNTNRNVSMVTFVYRDKGICTHTNLHVCIYNILVCGYR